MKRLIFLVLAGVVLWALPALASTNPFAEGKVTIEQTAAAVGSGESSATTGALKKATDSLAQANEKYSKLLKQFAADPEKYGDAKGDYREFVRQLTALGKRLGELQSKVNTLTAQAKKEEEKKKEEKEAAKPKTVAGTIKVSPYLNVRTGPWGKIIGSLHNNDKVTIIGSEGDWYKISHNGQTAYIHQNYVDTPTKKAGTTAVKEPGSSSSNAGANNTPVAKGGGFSAMPCSPMPSRASSEFGWRIHPTLGTRRFHNGIDLPVGNGTRLNALGNGVVIASGFESGGGNYIRVRYDNGYESFYCHLQRSTVSKGQRVTAGQEIAKSDNTGTYTTGAHLHFELKKNGQAVNPRSVLKLP
ncbi:MAG: hypothetical protein CVV41_14155 [Candidatus Riflebacteria bacterium HGW-Riflebacteria-1]|jgi:murein DD-endopeptidase MepM/ murein hydrolase activator NlpD|nr:MAG: hypothetical protein CVV41_14155 [Candidatus Riflebacteria bacterium HGW-Riflebacteria-1]